MLGSRRSSLVCCTVDTGCRRRLFRVLKVVSIVATEEGDLRVRPNGGPSQQSRALEEGSRGIRTFYVRGWWWIKSTDTRVVQYSGAVPVLWIQEGVLLTVSLFLCFLLSLLSLLSLFLPLCSGCCGYGIYCIIQLLLLCSVDLPRRRSWLQQISRPPTLTPTWPSLPLTKTGSCVSSISISSPSVLLLSLLFSLRQSHHTLHLHLPSGAVSQFLSFLFSTVV